LPRIQGTKLSLLVQSRHRKKEIFDLIRTLKTLKSTQIQQLGSRSLQKKQNEVLLHCAYTALCWAEKALKATQAENALKAVVSFRKESILHHLSQTM
jgi:hypothetical protein